MTASGILLNLPTYLPTYLHTSILTISLWMNIYVYRPIHLETAVLLGTSAGDDGSGVVGEALLLLSMRGVTPSDRTSLPETDDHRGGMDGVVNAVDAERQVAESSLPDKVAIINPQTGGGGATAPSTADCGEDGSTEKASTTATAAVTAAASGDDSKDKEEEPDLVLLNQAQEKLSEAINKVGGQAG